MTLDEYDCSSDNPPRKENALCCIQWKEAHDGKLPIGFCGPACHRRPKVWARIR